MKSVTAEEAGNALEKILRETSASHEPIKILSDASNGVLIAEDDWRALQETVYLLAIPGMRESIREGKNTPIEDCSEELTW